MIPTDSSDRTQTKGYVINVIFVLILAWLVLWYRKPVEASRLELFLASIIYCFCSIPVILYFANPRPVLPFLPVFSIVYFVYYGLSIFINYSNFIMLNREIVVKTLYLALIGFISFLVGFYGPPGMVMRNLIPHLSVPWDPRKAYRLGVFLGIFGNLVFYLGLAQGFVILSGGVNDFLSELSRLSIAILFLLQLQGKLNTGQKTIFWAIFTMRVLLDLSVGASTLILSELFILFFVYIFQRRRIPWIRLIIAILAFIMVFGARDRFRGMTWWGSEYSTKGPVSKSFLYLSLVKDRVLGKEQVIGDDYAKLTTRSDALVTFIRVAELTPEIIPYWGGYTYRTLFTSFLPRFLFPDKPYKRTGQEFGHHYTFLSEDDFSTSYNLPVLVEAFVNFGPEGVISIMFLVGCIFVFFYALLNHPGAGEGGIVIITVIFHNLCTLETDFSITFGNTLQYLVLFYLIIKLKVMKTPVVLEGR